MNDSNSVGMTVAQLEVEAAARNASKSFAAGMELAKRVLVGVDWAAPLTRAAAQGLASAMPQTPGGRRMWRVIVGAGI